MATRAVEVSGGMPVQVREWRVHQEEGQRRVGWARAAGIR